MTRTDRAGLCLVELLTAVGVVAVLAALLAPVYVSARSAALRTKCNSNLRGVGKAFEAYVADHDACYPCTGDPYLWMGRHFRWPLKKYVGFSAAYDGSDPRGPRQATRIADHILRCPADATPIDVWDGTSYGYSAAFYHTPAQINAMTIRDLYDDPDPELAVVRSAQVRYPTKKALAADWLSLHSDVKVGWWDWRGARNYLFADGHVKLLAATSIRPAVDFFPDINLTVDGVAGRDID